MTNHACVIAFAIWLVGVSVLLADEPIEPEELVKLAGQIQTQLDALDIDTALKTAQSLLVGREKLYGERHKKTIEALQIVVAIGEQAFAIEVVDRSLDRLRQIMVEQHGNEDTRTSAVELRLALWHEQTFLSSERLRGLDEASMATYVNAIVDARILAQMKHAYLTSLSEGMPTDEKRLLAMANYAYRLSETGVTGLPRVHPAIW